MFQHLVALHIVQHYSYTTCGSSADDFLAYQQQHALGGKDIVVAVPTYIDPYTYKRNSTDDILLSKGDEYYNNR